LPGAWGRVVFSPDGRWLATAGGGVRLWRVGTWQPGPALDSPNDLSFAFSPDGQLLALGGGTRGLVRLVSPDTGKEVARLQTPEESRLEPQCFSPDGTQLVLRGTESAAIHLIDLRAIRDQLGPLGLDWDAPQYPPAGEKPYPARLRMQVVP
jgi:WD40 repeat protein